jgi:hypothetical protein
MEKSLIRDPGSGKTSWIRNTAGTIVFFAYLHPQLTYYNKFPLSVRDRKESKFQKREKIKENSNFWSDERIRKSEMLTLALLSGPTSPKSSMMSSWVTEVCRFVITTFVPYKKKKCS